MVKSQNNNNIIKVLAIVILNLFVSCYLLLVTSHVSAQDSTPSATSTESSSIREKVREAIQSLTHKPKAVLGNLEQITDQTLQIKDDGGKISQVATTGETTYSKINTEGKKTEIKFTDLVIGNYIAALGYKNGNDILESKRVLVYDEKPKLGRQSMYGTVVETSKNTIKLKHIKLTETWSIEVDKDTIFTKRINNKLEEIEFSDLEIGDKIVVAGILSLKKDKTIFAGDVFGRRRGPECARGP